MPEPDKPYRVYRGGRVKGRVPTLTRPQRDPRTDGRAPRSYPGPGPKPKRRRFRWSRKRWVGVAFLLLALFLIAWTVAGYLAVRRGVDKANKRVTPERRSRFARSATTPDCPSTMSSSSTSRTFATRSTRSTV
jgi:hypothetical protein